MKASLFPQRQDTQFLPQLHRQFNSPASWSSRTPSPTAEDLTPHSGNDEYSCSETSSVEAKLASYSMPLLAGTEGPSPLDTGPVVLHKSNSEDDVGNSSIAPFAEDVLMDQLVLDYINEMLMDEGMEDRMCMQEDCITYQAIVNGFYKIIGEHWPDSSVDSSQDLRTSCYSSQPRLQADNTDEHDEYSWIDQVLNSSPSTPLLASSTNSQSSFPQKEIKAGDSSYLHTAKAEGPEQHVLEMEGPGNHVSLNYAGLEDVIRLSNWVQLDKTNFALQDDAAAAGSNAHSNREPGQQQQGDGRVQPIAYHDRSLASSADGDISFVKNKDLHVEENYANLYIGESSPSPRDLARSDHTKISINDGSNSSKKRSSTVNSKKDKGNSNGHDQNGGLGPVDLRELLMSCAQAVAAGNTRRANDVLEELRQHGASPNGHGLQRVAHYFSEALVARMSGTGGHLYTAISNNMPSTAKLLKAFKRAYEVCPYVTILHYFANQSILKAAEGASRLHIVDYGISYGLQWPYLINALADRKGGPPLLMITGIDFPQPVEAEGLEDIGRRLAEYARTYKVPFHYHAIAATKWEDVEPPLICPQQGEVLVVNCINRLRKLLDESVDVASSPRQKLLSRMRSLNPDLLVTSVVSAGYNAPFFVSRFREALDYYSSKFDMMDTTWGDNPERMIVERDCMSRDILNVVACEGVERVERPETYRQWQARIQRAGFEQLPIIPTILSRSRSHVKSYYHKHFNVDDRNRWMLLGWKGQTPMAISAWKPIPTIDR